MNHMSQAFEYNDMYKGDKTLNSIVIFGAFGNSRSLLKRTPIPWIWFLNSDFVDSVYFSINEILSKYVFATSSIIFYPQLRIIRKKGTDMTCI